MSLTKRQLIDEALAELALSPEFYDVTPGQYQRAMTRMDLMVANWQNNAIRIDYNLANPPGSGDLDDDSGVPDISQLAVVLGTAKQIAPMFGKSPSAETNQNFKDAYDNLFQNAVAIIPEIQRPNTLSRGAGQKYWRVGTRSTFYPAPAEPLTDGAESEIEYSPSYVQSEATSGNT